MTRKASDPAGNSGVFSSLRWARLNYSEGSKLWHATEGQQSLCGAVSFAHPRAEYRAALPEGGRLCKRCAANLERGAPCA